MIENHQKMTRRILQGDYRALLVNIEEKYYPISYEVLHQIFSSFEHLKDITVFESGSKFHSRICFQSSEAAVQAIQSLQDRCIYDDCCRLKILLATEASCLTQGMKKVLHDISTSSNSVQISTKIMNDNSEVEVELDVVEIDEVEIDVVEIVEVENISSITIDNTHLYAHNVFDQMPKETEAIIPQSKSVECGTEVQMDNLEQEEPKLDDMKVFYKSPFRKFMAKFLEIEVSLFSAHKLFDIMSDEKNDSNGDIRTSKVHTEFLLLDESVKEIGKNLNHYLCNLVKVFDPGGVQGVPKLMQTPIWLAFDPGGRSHISSWLPTDMSHTIHNIEAESVMFDRRKLGLFLGDWVTTLHWEIMDKLETTMVDTMNKSRVHSTLQLLVAKSWESHKSVFSAKELNQFYLSDELVKGWWLNLKRCTVFNGHNKFGKKDGHSSLVSFYPEIFGYFIHGWVFAKVSEVIDNILVTTTVFDQGKFGLFVAATTVFDPGKSSQQRMLSTGLGNDILLQLLRVMFSSSTTDNIVFNSHSTLRARLLDGESSMVYEKGSSMERVYKMRDIQVHGDRLYHTTHMKDYTKMVVCVEVHKVFDSGGYSQGDASYHSLIRLHILVFKELSTIYFHFQ